jgi:uncharacterized protein
MQQTLHILKTVELFRLLIVGVVGPLGQLQLQRLQALFELHDPLGQGMGGLGEILCVASDPERNGFRGHNGGGMMPMTTQISSLAKQGSTEAPQPARAENGVMTNPMALPIVILAGIGGGLLALRTGIPAAPLAGALLAAGAVSLSGQVEPVHWPPGTRTVLEIAIGTVIGSGLTAAAVQDLRELWRPALLITLSLVMAGLVIALLCSRLLGIDPVVALLGAAPGGISGMSLVGAEFGVGASVAALHAIRLITVLIVLPLVVRVVAPQVGPPG